MKVTVLVGGVGGARFLLGVQQLLGLGQFATPDGALQDAGHELTAVVNIGDDAWIHGLRVCPDLDTCMYTLGGGVDPERGWGHRDETWHAKEELARYGMQPDWFGLGDRDLATHLVRTQMLRAGYPLSQVTAALCDRWQPGARLLPASDDRCETHVVVTDPVDDAPRAIHFQEWWVRYRAQLPTHSFAFVGAEKASAATEAVAAIGEADIIMLAPSNPVVSIGAILAVPGIRGALRSATAPIVGYSPIIGGKPLRGMADACLAVIGVDSTAEAVGRHYGGRRTTGILDFWLVHDGDHAEIDDVMVASAPLLMNDPKATAEMVRAGLDLAGVTPVGDDAERSDAEERRQ
ncbi:2-phospho-L-lactate transferase [Mycobacterium riyadhense]|uniref:Phosphoenolpyruvate transferase n=1 Tax=Mycobacterium riyadhense TaxID=486698 RepID=A0A1X2D5E7_9MYCO|nr:2-phospho-L-lactate transferase [Mycobacterium riyadhense]MCV7148442.1 2-phospho-L-lactate transferase [Mycobacterium riyadhense]ORW83435.1 2-phospho-L-lactate transferase [Mycobacterium riyadhense]